MERKLCLAKLENKHDPKVQKILLSYWVIESWVHVWAGDSGWLFSNETLPRFGISLNDSIGLLS